MGPGQGQGQTHHGIPEKKSRALQACCEELVGIPGHGVSPMVGTAKLGQLAPPQTAQPNSPPFPDLSKGALGSPQPSSQEELPCQPSELPAPIHHLSNPTPTNLLLTLPSKVP